MSVLPATVEPASAVHSPAPASARALLSLQGMGKRFGAFRALGDVSLEIVPGEIHCLLGENGAGKSTLCNLIFGVYQPDEGVMTFDGQPYRPTGPADALARHVAMVSSAPFELIQGAV